jgi:hypothetical protein
MSENLVRSVLKEYIEAGVPDEKDPWPAIRAMLPQAHASDATTPITGQATETVAAQPQGYAPASARRFRVNGAMALVALLMVAGLTVLFVATRQPNVQPVPLSAIPLRSEFLPAGMVRHMVLTGSYTVDQSALNKPVTTTEQHREEFWLAQGQTHPLMKDVVTVPISATNWLDDNAYYSYEPAKGNEISWGPYNPQLLVSVLPDPEIITNTLQMQNAHLVGNDTLNGRPVVVITVGDVATPAATPTAKVGSSYKNKVVTYWIDRETNQVLQYSIETTTVGGAQSGLVERTVNKIALDELLPRSAFPADFFNFTLPEGTVFYNGLTPTPAITPAPGKP